MLAVAGVDVVLPATSLLFEVGVASITSERLRLDRHRRNAPSRCSTPPSTRRGRSAITCSTAPHCRSRGARANEKPRHEASAATDAMMLSELGQHARLTQRPVAADDIGGAVQTQVEQGRRRQAGRVAL